MTSRTDRPTDQPREPGIEVADRPSISFPGNLSSSFEIGIGDRTPVKRTVDNLKTFPKSDDRRCVSIKKSTYHEYIAESDSCHARFRELLQQVRDRSWVKSQDTELLSVIHILINFLRNKRKCQTIINYRSNFTIYYQPARLLRSSGKNLLRNLTYNLKTSGERWTGWQIAYE